MTNTAFIVSSDPGSKTSTANTTQFWPINADLNVMTTEANFQQTIRSPGLYKNMTVVLTANSLNAPGVTFTFSKNGASGKQTVSFTATTTGTAQDLTHSDFVVATDKIDVKGVPGTTGTYAANIMTFLFDSAQNFVTRMVTTTALAGESYTTGSAFNVLQGLLATNASNEAGVKCVQQKAGTLRNLQVNVSVNAKTVALTFISRKNTANGNLTASIGIGATGVFEDFFTNTGHSDSVVAGDFWNSSIVNGTDTTHAMTFNLMAADFQTTIGNFFQLIAGASADVAGTVSVTRFMPLAGRCAFNATESLCQIKSLAPFTFSNMSVHCTIAAAAAVTITFRNNTAAGKQTVSITNQTGAFSDAVNKDIVQTGDLLDYSFVFGTTAPSFSKVSVWGYSYNPQNFRCVSAPRGALFSTSQAPVFG